MSRIIKASPSSHTPSSAGSPRIIKATDPRALGATPLCLPPTESATASGDRRRDLPTNG